MLLDLATRGFDGMGLIRSAGPGISLDRGPQGFAYVRCGYTETDKDRAFLYSQGW